MHLGEGVSGPKPKVSKRSLKSLLGSGPKSPKKSRKRPEKSKRSLKIVGVLRRGSEKAVSRRCLERPLVEYAPLGVRPKRFLEICRTFLENFFGLLGSQARETFPRLFGDFLAFGVATGGTRNRVQLRMSSTKPGFATTQEVQTVENKKQTVCRLGGVPKVKLRKVFWQSFGVADSRRL